MHKYKSRIFFLRDCPFVYFFTGIHCMLCVIKDKTLQELEEVSQQHLRLIEMYKADGR